MNPVELWWNCIATSYSIYVYGIYEHWRSRCYAWTNHLNTWARKQDNIKENEYIVINSTIVTYKFHCEMQSAHLCFAMALRPAAPNLEDAHRVHSNCVLLAK